MSTPVTGTNAAVQATPKSSQSEPPPLLELAYFYEPFWRTGAAVGIKSLLLFFDGIALTVPDYASRAPFAAAWASAEVLAEQGLLRCLPPEFLIDRPAAEAVAQLLEALLADNAFDTLDRRVQYWAVPRFGRRSGNSSEPIMTDLVIAELIDHGLAKASGDGAAASLHPVVRSCVLVALPQILRESAERLGYALQPITTHPEQLNALLGFSSLKPLPTAGHLVTRHPEPVTLDLSSIPLADVLSFRSEFGQAHRAYAHEARKMLRDLAVIPETDRDEAWLDRREALAEAADDLRRTARKVWHRPLALCALGIAGGAVSLGDIRGGLAAPAARFLGLGRNEDPGCAYTYLFESPNLSNHLLSPAGNA